MVKNKAQQLLERIGTDALGITNLADQARKAGVDSPELDEVARAAAFITATAANLSVRAAGPSSTAEAPEAPEAPEASSQGGPPGRGPAVVKAAPRASLKPGG